MAKKTIDTVDVASKRVLMRVDFNVPTDESGQVTDDRRIRHSLPSIKSVIERGGRLVLMSHLGRPDGTGYEKEYSLKPAADRLSDLLSGVKVHFPDTDCVSEKSARVVESMQDSEIVLLENLRFHREEQKGDGAFARSLAAYGDIYCNEAFAACHRHDASMLAVPRLMEDKPRVAGFLLRDELRYLSDTIAGAERPFVAVLGGAKVSDKLGAIGNLMNRVDVILVGGAMAYTFVKALGHNVGSSLVQLGMIEKARKMIDELGTSKTELHLPSDHVCGKQVTQMSPMEVFKESIPDGWMGLDIGPDTTSHYAEVLRSAKTIVWNGPMGVVETPPFDVGTRRIAEAIGEVTDRGATSIVGGGDSAAAIEAFGLSDRFSHVSTGGGASLELLEGKRFETVSILDDA